MTDGGGVGIERGLSGLPLREVDWSQSGEQPVILEWARRYGKLGRFLDIGAFDGETCSNSRALYLAGWHGVLVEPAARAFHQLARLYRNDPRAVLVNACVTAEEEGLTTLWYSDEMLSSTSRDHVALWHPSPFTEVHVMGLRLGALLNYFGPFDLVSIDTEGTTFDLLRAYEQHPHMAAVQFFCVEGGDGAEMDEMASFVGAEFRTVARTPNNILLERVER